MPLSLLLLLLLLCAKVGIDIGFHVQSFLSKADMGVRMTGGNVAVMGDMVRWVTRANMGDILGRRVTW